MGAPWALSALCVVWAVALVVTDVRSRRLPDVLTLPAAVVAVGGAVWGGDGHAWAVLGGVCWFLLCVLPGLLSRRFTAGGGDAKLALSLGTVATVTGGVPGLLLAIGGASVVTLFLAAFPRIRSSGEGIPHGPGMLVATLCSMVILS